MDLLFIVLCAVILPQSFAALLNCIRFALYSLRSRYERRNPYRPKALLIVPCKGIDYGFEENIRAMLSQDYRDYDVVFVVEHEYDPAYSVLTRIMKSHRRSAWMVTAGQAEQCGQKVHNLCAAIDMINALDRRAEVLVFADSDARPSRQWLANLIDPLSDRNVGATTGFRWFIPSGYLFFGVISKFPSIIASIWNAGALSLLGENSSFAWGGSMAIRRDTFDALQIRRRWEGSVSDDYVLTAAVRDAALKIKFVPQCLTASHIDMRVSDLLEFTVRQMRITRVYSPGVWKLAAAAHITYNAMFWGGLLRLVYSKIAFGQVNFTLLYLFLGIYGLGALTGLIRVVTASSCVDLDRSLIKHKWAYVFTYPLASLVYVYNILASVKQRRIVWRGIDYELISPNKTIIHNRPKVVFPEPTLNTKAFDKMEVGNQHGDTEKQRQREIF